MLSFKNKKIILSLFAGLTFTSAVSAVDLTVNLEPSVKVNSKLQQINYFANVQNLSNASYAGPVKILAFLLPTQASPIGETSIKGVMLRSVTINLDLAANGSNRFEIQMDIPYTPKGNYLLGGFINSTRSVLETSAPTAAPDAAFNNNVTPDLIPVGNLENLEFNPEDDSGDLYSDIRGEINALDGATSHAWRLFMRGRVATTGLRALFLVANLPSKKLYHASYEKGVGWRDMGQAYDKNGNLLPYDVYHQAPRFEHVPEGNHHLVTLVNYNEAISENTANNVDLAAFKAAKISVFPSQVWKVIQDGEPVVLNEAFYLQTQYAAPVAWSLDSSSLPSSATVNMTSGSLVRTQALALTGTADNFAGKAEWKLSLDAAGKKIEVPVKLFKVGADAAALGVDSPFSVTAVSPFSPEIQHIALRNTGASTLYWRVKNATSWIHLLGSQSGEIAAGKEQTLLAALEGRALNVGMNTGEIVIQTNTLEGEKRITVQLDMTAPR